ncbi:hypothetical protein [Actinomadura livida]|uniref:Uncharacterized protein n=1 Tax=Actinomadura livida TaxID=79909 RepID=A0A7W7IAU5_9ACTN|nr:MULTISPECIES: hypothetical protein [Actinomadura]MBB4773623.1 hypothetical protein [Actinomadura catellatispora]GGU09585.1 hypothetical protein GCM10010208_37660 [Actinomadura livida]
MFAGIRGYFSKQEVLDLPRFSDEDAAEIAREYWLRAIRADESSRSRAQIAYTITSALSTVGIGIFFTAGLKAQAVPTKILAIIAVLLWILATFLYLAAVSSGAKQDDDDEASSDEQSFVDEQIDVGDLAVAGMMEVQEARAVVLARLRGANAASFAAILFAVMAFIASTFYAPKQEVNGLIVMTKAGSATLTSTCKRQIANLDGVINKDDLKSPFVSISVSSKSSCFAGKNVIVQRSWISAVVENR